MLQIKHQDTDVFGSPTWPRASFVIEVPEDKKELISLLLNGDQYKDFNIGVTLVHPKDQFNKKIGRETALSKIKTYCPKLNSVKTRDENRTVFEFSTSFSNSIKVYTIVFGISFVPKSSKTRLEYMYMEQL